MSGWRHSFNQNLPIQRDTRGVKDAGTDGEEDMGRYCDALWYFHLVTSLASQETVSIHQGNS